MLITACLVVCVLQQLCQWGRGGITAFVVLDCWFAYALMYGRCALSVLLLGEDAGISDGKGFFPVGPGELHRLARRQDAPCLQCRWCAA